MTQQRPEPPRPDATEIAAELLDRVIVPGMEIFVRIVAQIAVILGVGRYMRWW